MKLKLPFGLKEGKILHISQVEQGLKCGCICPNCQHPLVARKGSKTTHHFAHYKGKECEKALETALHIAAKEILSRSKRIILPGVYLRLKHYRFDKFWLLSNQRSFAIDRVELEPYQKDYVPDVIAYINDTPLIIEITVTHKTEENKINKIRNEGISVLEIDLSEYERDFTLRNLENEIINNYYNKNWLYNNQLTKLTALLHNLAEKKVFTTDAVPYCPKGLKEWIIEQNCFSCEYCVHIEKGDHLTTTIIYCLGELKISNFEELFAYLKEHSKG